MSQDSNKNLKWGMGISIACSVHCFFTPVLLLLFPFSSTFYKYSSIVEIIFLISILLLGGKALWHDYLNHHGKTLPLYMFAAGFLILFIYQVFFHSHHNEQYKSILDNILHIWPLILGSILLATSQLLGFFWRKSHHA